MAQTGDIRQQNAETSIEGGPRDAITSTGRQRLLRVLASNWLLCLLVFGAALVFDLHNLGTPSIWFDEAFSVELARQPLPLLWHIIWGPEPNMELYYLFLHFWLGLTGLLGFNPVEAVVRLPSAIFAALASVMVFLLGRRYLGLVAGITGAGLFTLNYLQLTYAQQTRTYSLQLLLTCIAWYALFALFTRETHTKRWWACFIVANTLAVYAHLFSILIIVAQVVAFGGLLLLPGPWRAVARRRLRPFIASLLLTGVLIIPMLLESLQGPKTGWLPVPHLHEVVALFQLITASSNLYLLILFVGCFCALLIALLPHMSDSGPLLQSVTFYRPGDQQSEQKIQQLLPVAFALVCWFFVPIISSFIVSQGSIRLFSTRYLVTVLPPLFLLVGLAVFALRWRGVQIALVVGLFLIALYLVPVYYRSAQVEDWNSTVHWLEQRSQPGDGLVCFDNDVQQGCQIAVEYYLHAYPNGTHFTSDSPGAFSWENFGPVDPATGSNAAVDPHALSAYAARHPRLFYIVGRVPTDAAAAQARVAQQWLDSHYHLLGRIHTPTVTISWYSTS
ncbi:MAG TPA: glycosyltransferase family 39 protein [Ktedonobacteraceae bacterium]|nr:glycosyltransferase family 39 protein [Ktedonobacteraceae bacterium]